MLWHQECLYQQGRGFTIKKRIFHAQHSSILREAEAAVLLWNSGASMLRHTCVRSLVACTFLRPDDKLAGGGERLPLDAACRNPYWMRRRFRWRWVESTDDRPGPDSGDVCCDMPIATSYLRSYRFVPADLLLWRSASIFRCTFFRENHWAGAWTQTLS